MNSTGQAANADYPATMSDEAMTTLIAEGRAEPWNHDLRADVPHAVLLDGAWRPNERGALILSAGTWYAVYGDSEGYRMATPELAAILTRDAARLRAADQAVVDVDARNGT